MGHFGGLLARPLGMSNSFISFGRLGFQSKTASMTVRVTIVRNERQLSTARKTPGRCRSCRMMSGRGAIRAWTGEAVRSYPTGERLCPTPQRDRADRSRARLAALPITSSGFLPPDSLQFLVRLHVRGLHRARLQPTVDHAHLAASWPAGQRDHGRYFEGATAGHRAEGSPAHAVGHVPQGLRGHAMRSCV